MTYSGGVLSWGTNSHGQCGIPPSSASFVPHPIALLLPSRSSRSSASSERVGSPLDASAWQVSCGLHHAACITRCGAVVCWGSNTMHQLGQPCTTHHGPMNPVLSHAGPFCLVECGGAHTVALAHDSSVFAWGSNSYGTPFALFIYKEREREREREREKDAYIYTYVYMYIYV